NHSSQLLQQNKLQSLKKQIPSEIKFKNLNQNNLINNNNNKNHTYSAVKLIKQDGLIQYTKRKQKLNIKDNNTNLFKIPPPPKPINDKILNNKYNTSLKNLSNGLPPPPKPSNLFSSIPVSKTGTLESLYHTPNWHFLNDHVLRLNPNLFNTNEAVLTSSKLSLNTTNGRYLQSEYLINKTKYNNSATLSNNILYNCNISIHSNKTTDLCLSYNEE